MDERTHQHGAHGHGGRVHVHATVDHLASDTGQSARLAIRLDGALMEALGVTADAIVRLATDRGRSMLVRLDPPDDADRGTGTVRLDRFVRQALKAHLNESVDIENADARPVQRVELNPAVDVSMAHDLVPALQKKIRDCTYEFRFPADMQKGFQGADRWLPIDYKKDWEIVRRVASDSGQSFNKAAFEKEKARAEAAAAAAAAKK